MNQVADKTLFASLFASVRRRRFDPIPGRALTLGATVFYVAVLIVLPLLALLFQAFGTGQSDFLATILEPRVLASLKLSIGMALLAALLNVLFGTLLAYVLTRYRFPGRKLVDALIDLPYALPTAVAGLALTSIYSERGWMGGLLSSQGLQVAFAPPGILIALVFVGLPFQVRVLQPLLLAQGPSQEEAAATLGARPWQSFCLVLLPALVPGLLTGFALTFARGLGEYGSVIFIAGNIPMVSEIAPVLVVSKLEQFNYPGAAAVATALLVLSLAVLSILGYAERCYRRTYYGGSR